MKATKVNIILLALVFIWLNTVDFIFTRAILEMGLGREGNTLLVAVTENIAFFGAWKLVVSTGLSALLLVIARKHQNSIQRIFSGLVLAMIVVCIWNAIFLVR